MTVDDGAGDVTAPANPPWPPARHGGRPWLSALTACSGRQGRGPCGPHPGLRAPRQGGTVLPYLDPRRSGVIMAGATTGKGMQAMEGTAASVPRLIDPAGHEKYIATCDAPFLLPEGQLQEVSLDNVLDDQLQAGVTVAMTPTGYIPAGRTDILRAAAEQFRQLGRDDVIFVAPLDVSLVDRAYIKTTTAILASLGGPVALILGRQFDPLDQSKRIIPNLHELAAAIPLMPARTDFNGFDLAAHGAFAAAIGTGGSLRHAVNPLEKPLAFRPGRDSPPTPRPACLCPSWRPGSRAVDRPAVRRPAAIVPRCRLPGMRRPAAGPFPEARGPGRRHRPRVAVWSEWAADLLDQPTVRDRAVYWRNLCCGAVATHAVFRRQLKIMDERTLQPQGPLGVWAAQAGMASREHARHGLITGPRRWPVGRRPRTATTRPGWVPSRSPARDPARPRRTPRRWPSRFRTRGPGQRLGRVSAEVGTTRSWGSRTRIATPPPGHRASSRA